ncbi:MAG: DUF1206 domain-containing protein [Rubricoccaceae bacterium]
MTVLDRAARVGFIAKGIVYLLIGGLSVRAVSAGRDAKGPAGVIEELVDAPLNEVLLVATAVGLACYGLWRIIGSALFPADGEGGLKGWSKRLGYVSTGTTHLLFAGYAVYLALGYDAGEGDGAEQALTAVVLAWPGGVWLIGGLGVAFFGVAGFQLYQGFVKDPLEPHRTAEMSEGEQRLACWVARAGLAARAVVFAIIGAFLVVAAWQTDPDEVRGLGDALGEVAAQPYGTALLVVTALGFAAYGVYCFSLARYARFDTSVGRVVEGRPADGWAWPGAGTPARERS